MIDCFHVMLLVLAGTTVGMTTSAVLAQFAYVHSDHDRVCSVVLWRRPSSTNRPTRLHAVLYMAFLFRRYPSNAAQSLMPSYTVSMGVLGTRVVCPF